MPNREIKLGDEVKNINGNSITGKVITKWTDEGSTPKTFLDVNTGERIYWATPIEHWETIHPVEELE